MNVFLNYISLQYIAQCHFLMFEIIIASLPCLHIYKTKGHSILPSRRAILEIFSQSDKYGEQVLASSPNLTLPVMRKFPLPFLTWHFFGTTILPYRCWMSEFGAKCKAPNFLTTRVTWNSTSVLSSISLCLACPISPMKTTIQMKSIRISVFFNLEPL